MNGNNVKERFNRYISFLSNGLLSLSLSKDSTDNKTKCRLDSEGHIRKLNSDNDFTTQNANDYDYFFMLNEDSETFISPS